MLFQVERDLSVGHLAPQRHKGVGDERSECGHREEAEPDDRGDAELEGLQAGCRQQQHRHHAHDDNDRAPRRDAKAPAVPDAPNDVDELCAMIHVRGPLRKRLPPDKAKSGPATEISLFGTNGSR